MRSEPPLLAVFPPSVAALFLVLVELRVALSGSNSDNESVISPPFPANAPRTFTSADWSIFWQFRVGIAPENA
jgi:hypothetical protein